MTSSGDLNRRITLQQTTKVPDGGGGFTSTWVDVATVWAKAWTVSSQETTGAMQSSLIRVQKFVIRFRSVLRASWRVKYGARYFNITGIDPDAKNEFVYLTCKEAAG